MNGKVGRSKKEELPKPKCADTRECRFRDKEGKCTILNSTYDPGKCPFCKPKGADEKPERKRKKPLSAGQVVDSYLNLSAKHVREPDCQFYIGTKRTRLMCKATHNKDCKGCRFYSANKAVRTEAIAAYLLQAEKDLTIMRDEVRSLRSTTRNINEIKDYARIGKSVVRHMNKSKRRENKA